MEIIIYLTIGILLGSLGIYLYIKPAFKLKQSLNYKIITTNNVLESKKEQYIREIEELKKEKIEYLEKIQKQTEEVETNYQKNYALVNEKMDKAAQNLSINFRKEKEKIEKEYLNTLKDYSDNFQKQIEIKQEEILKVENQLKDLASKVSAAVEANKRAEEIKNKQDFYRLQLSQKDIAEIAKLREVSCLLRDEEPLNKVIWKVYYEKPYTDLVGRVIGTGVHTGIYKITNIKNQMCYVGQSKDLISRWKQHIKRGIGAETPTKNKLYTAMLEDGVENFTFEVIEECEKELLNEREQFWQKHFHSKDYGYSIK